MDRPRRRRREIVDRAIGDHQRAAVDLATHRAPPRDRRAIVPTETAIRAERLVRWLDESRRRHQPSAVRRHLPSRSRPDAAPLRRTAARSPNRCIDRALTTQAILDQEAGAHRLGRPAARLRRHRQPSSRRPKRSSNSTPPRPTPPPPSPAAPTSSSSSARPAPARPPRLRPAVAQLRADGRAVFGVAPSATAAEVLAVETGVSRRHARQAPHRAPPQTGHPTTATTSRSARR